MKKHMWMGVAAVACFAVAGSAAAKDGAGWFVGAQVGKATSSFVTVPYFDERVKDSGATLGVNGGFRWALGDQWSFGPELAYQKFGTSTFTGTDDVGPYAGRHKISTIAWGGNVRFALSDRWYVTGRAGWQNWRASSSFQSVEGQVKSRIRDNGNYLGLGVGFNVAPSWSIGLSVDKYWMATRSDEDRIHFNLRTVQLSTEYRF
ncbi:OOP family OmpA-OmpF porin [Luteibacter rhizovicinus]|uniref:OOP family OmpA-OmpF porin n=1 Tax=Luteibacter rhizovicinus TaxID=242606 RepID=A0A4V2W4F2_9GAMM|nr:outer membrane beta-barrel protein [Luteibacter rhizovicinus]TCV95669.1 OOP family OmpA-OmpF porin [Luteibacter rhizovicinus]